MKNVLVFGGTGFIGSEIVYQLCKTRKYKVYSFSRHKSDYCTSFIGDVNNINDIEQVYMNLEIDITIICYGLKSISNSKNVSLYAQNDLTGLVNILNCCDIYNCKRVMYFSSSAVYKGCMEDKDTYLLEDSAISTESFYSFLKFENENLIKWYARYRGINYKIFRCFNAYGKNSIGQIQNDFFYILSKNHEVTIFGKDCNTHDGTLVRDYIHVMDIGRVVVDSLSTKGNSIINLGTGNGYSLLDIVKIFEIKLKEKLKVVYGPRREYDQDCLIANISEIKKIIKGRNLIKLEEGIQDYL